MEISRAEKYVRFLVIAAGMLAWFLWCFSSILSFLPSRPDSVAYFLAQLMFLPGLFLSSPRLLQVGERLRTLGERLIIVSLGAFVVAAVLFIFGGYRAAATL